MTREQRLMELVERLRRSKDEGSRVCALELEAILNEESEGWDLKFRIYHASDCAKNNMPATPNGDCNCGALPDAVPKNFEEWPGPSDHDDWRDYGYERGWNAYRDALLAAPTRSADGGEK